MFAKKHGLVSHGMPSREEVKYDAYSVSSKALPKVIFRVDVPIILWYLSSQSHLESPKEACFTPLTRGLGRRGFGFGTSCATRSAADRDTTGGFARAAAAMTSSFGAGLKPKAARPPEGVAFAELFFFSVRTGGMMRVSV